MIKMLSDCDLHSIEQPIPPGHPEAMAAICENSPIPVALDEELNWKAYFIRKEENCSRP